VESFDLAVIGSGIGGSLTAALNSHKETILFEKDKNLGGCASTFKRFGNYYNAGATTLVGYEKNHPLKNIFDEVGITPNIEKSEVAIRVIQGEKQLDRVQDFEEFLASVEKLYPNKNNRVFWSKIKSLDEKFWTLKDIYYGKYSWDNYLKTASSIGKIVKAFQLDIFKSADSFIKQTLGDISKEYQDFIDAQLLITVQARSKDISLLSLALGLSYPFHDVFYVNGGMGSLIEEIVKKVELHRDEEIKKIKKDSNGWIVQSNKAEYKAKEIVLNSSIYQSDNLFEDEEIKNYYNSYMFSDQSAFVIYMTIDSKDKFLDHYQIIEKENFPNSTSNSFFISFSKKSDQKLSKNGYSVTISTHTKANYWKYLPRTQYKAEKEKTMQAIVKAFLEYFTSIEKEEIKHCFSATSFTFNRYINRYNCGGHAVSLKNIHQFASCTTPFKGLYNVGDTIVSGQGWPGVALGATILNRELNGSSRT
jgi:phytoene dehydrogenase-like protein